MSEEDTPQVEIPEYKCHKKVRALKIKSVQPRYERNDTSKPCFEVRLGIEDPRFAPITLPGAYYEKHKPEAGGYYVAYEDGYQSYSPAEPFESGYALADEAEEIAPEFKVLMRAKLVVDRVEAHDDGSETIMFRAVCKDDGYDESGKDENNNFARFTPVADLQMLINNPDLNGLLKSGMQFYTQFIPAPPVAVPAVDPTEKQDFEKEYPTDFSDEPTD
jgi:hypothetical protein